MTIGRKDEGGNPMKTIYRVSHTKHEAHLLRPGNRNMVLAKITNGFYDWSDSDTVADFDTEKGALEFAQKQDLTPMLKPANAGGLLLLWDSYLVNKVFVDDDGYEECSDDCADEQIVSHTVDQLALFVEQSRNREEED